MIEAELSKALGRGRYVCLTASAAHAAGAEGLGDEEPAATVPPKEARCSLKNAAQLTTRSKNAHFVCCLPRGGQLFASRGKAGGFNLITFSTSVTGRSFAPA